MLHFNPRQPIVFFAALAIIAVQSLLSGCSTTTTVKDKDNVNPYQKVQTLMGKGNYERAIPLLEDLTQSEPDKASIAINLTIAYRETGLLDEAMNTIAGVIKHHPDQAPAYNQLGIIERKLGHFDQAREAYQRAIALDNNYALAQRNLGILYDIYLQKPDLALGHYQTYQALINEEDKTTSNWIIDLKRRLEIK